LEVMAPPVGEPEKAARNAGRRGHRGGRRAKPNAGQGKKASGSSDEGCDTQKTLPETQTEHATPKKDERCDSTQGGARATDAANAWSGLSKAAPGTSAWGGKEHAAPTNQARGWAELSAAEMDSRTTQLQEMGFGRGASRDALQACDWEVNTALDFLLTNKPLPSKAPARARPQKGPGASPTAMPSPAAHSSPGSSTTASRGSTPRRMCSGTSTVGTSTPATTSDAVFFGDVPLPPGLESLMPGALLPEPPGLGLGPPGLGPAKAEEKLHLDSLISPTAAPSAAPSVGILPPSAVPPAPTFAPTIPSGAIDEPPAPPHESPIVSVVPRRRLARVKHAWAREEWCKETQLSVEAGAFINVWTDSATQQGWVYAESLICSSNAGWLPGSMLHELPPYQFWVRATTKCQATYASQLSVDTGAVLKVDVTKRTDGGWVFADVPEPADGHHGVDASQVSGWVPAACLDWSQL